nr:uncharacterized protein LOC105850934 [Hydra vulgaris]
MAIYSRILFHLTIVLMYLSETRCSDLSQKIEMKRIQDRLELKEAMESAAEFGEKMPVFANKRDEILWKLNLAKKTLKKAHELEKVARNSAEHFGYFENDKQKHSEVNELLGKADETLMSAGEKMGFDFEKY